MAVDRLSKLAFARVYRKASMLTAGAFLKSLIRSVPYRMHTELTDNGIQFTNLGHPSSTRETLLERSCRLRGIEHRLTKSYHPWSNGQAEHMVRTLKDATTRAFHYKLSTSCAGKWPTTSRPTTMQSNSRR